MSLLQTWRDKAYDQNADKGALQRFWQQYFLIEKGIYEQLLTNPDEEVKGTVKELADKYNIDVFTMTGFLDGINTSLNAANDLESITEETELDLDVDFEKLFFNMLKADADYLYTLEEWNDVLTEEKMVQIVKDFKRSKTVHKEKEPGRNDPCPCGSGKKYKKCCGANK